MAGAAHQRRKVLAFQDHPRPHPRFAARVANGDEGHRVIYLVSPDACGVGIQQVTHLGSNSVEDLGRWRAPSHQRRHPSQRGVFLGGAVNLSHVPRSGVDHTLGQHPTAVPLKPARRAITAHAPECKLGHLLPAGQGIEPLTGSCPVVRVDQVEPRDGEQFLSRIPQRPLDSRIHPPEITIEARDAE